jgi:hypothetical protein
MAELNKAQIKVVTEKLKSNFSDYDKDEDGRINKSEFEKFSSINLPKLNQKDRQDAFNQLAKYGDKRQIESYEIIAHSESTIEKQKTLDGLSKEHNTLENKINNPLSGSSTDRYNAIDESIKIGQKISDYKVALAIDLKLVLTNDMRTDLKNFFNYRKSVLVNDDQISTREYEPIREMRSICGADLKSILKLPPEMNLSITSSKESQKSAIHFDRDNQSFYLEVKIKGTPYDQFIGSPTIKVYENGEVKNDRNQSIKNPEELKKYLENHSKFESGLKQTFDDIKSYAEKCDKNIKFRGRNQSGEILVLENGSSHEFSGYNDLFTVLMKGPKDKSYSVLEVVHSVRMKDGGTTILELMSKKGESLKLVIPFVGRLGPSPSPTLNDVPLIREPK